MITFDGIQIPGDDKELDAMSNDEIAKMIYQLNCSKERHMGAILGSEVSVKTALFEMAKVDLQTVDRLATSEEKRQRLVLNFNLREAQLALSTARRDYALADNAVNFYQAVLFNRTSKGSANATGSQG